MPLVGLENIEWDKLRHCYGSAKDIPDLLRALDDAESEDEFYKLIYKLWSYINHQGDHYNSTPACVPFLFQILRNKQLTEQKLAVLIDLAELLRTLRKDANNYPIIDEAEESKTYSAIANELEYLLRLLLGEKLELRVGSLYILSFLHQQSEQILPALLECIQTTDETELKASAIWVYAQFAKLVPISDREKHLMEWTKSPALLVQYAAAFGYMSIPVPVVPVAEHIISLVAQAQTTKDWSMKESSSKALLYLYSELMFDLLGK